MPHGQPDWGRTAGLATTFQLTDLGEHAARLGSIVTHDRRGDLLWMDDLEEGLVKWAKFTLGTGAGIASSQARARSGSNSCALTGGSDVSNAAQISRRVPINNLAQFGVELSFSLDAAIDNLTLTVNVLDGTNGQTYTIRWTDNTNDLVFLNGSSVLETLDADLDLEANAALFHTIKLVVAPTALEYVRLIVNETVHDLSGEAATSTPDATSPHIAIIITMSSRAGSNDVVWIDDVILTQNEP